MSLHHGITAIFLSFILIATDALANPISSYEFYPIGLGLAGAAATAVAGLGVATTAGVGAMAGATAGAVAGVSTLALPVVAVGAVGATGLAAFTSSYALKGFSHLYEKGYFNDYGYLQKNYESKSYEQKSYVPHKLYQQPLYSGSSHIAMYKPYHLISRKGTTWFRDQRPFGGAVRGRSRVSKLKYLEDIYGPQALA